MTSTVEIVKSITLAVLVITSLIFSSLIWSGAALRYTMTDWDDEAYRPEPRQLEIDTLRRLIAPRQIVIGLNDVAVVFSPGFAGYDRIWSTASELLLQMTSFELIQTLPDDSSSLIQLICSTAIPIEVWEKAWSLSGYDLPDGSINRIHVDVDNEWIALELDSDAELRYLFAQNPSDPAFDRLANLIEDVRHARLPEYMDAATTYHELPLADGIYLPVNPPALARIQTQPEALNPDEIASEFFADLAAIDKISEPDQVIIYTDGHRVLRVFPGGGFEYAAPEHAQFIGGQTSILNKMAVSFDAIRTWGGIPDELHVTSFPDQNDQVIAFSYRYLGLPVLGERGVIAVTTHGLQVVDYRRQVRVPIGPSQPPATIIDWRDAVEQVIHAFADTDNLTIKDAYLAYVLCERAEPEPILRPSWVFELAGATVAIDGHTGEGWLWTGNERKPF